MDKHVELQRFDDGRGQGGVLLVLVVVPDHAGPGRDDHRQVAAIIFGLIAGSLILLNILEKKWSKQDIERGPMLSR